MYFHMPNVLKYISLPCSVIRAVVCRHKMQIILSKYNSWHLTGDNIIVVYSCLFLTMETAR